MFLNPTSHGGTEQEDLTLRSTILSATYVFYVLGEVPYLPLYRSNPTGFMGANDLILTLFLLAISHSLSLQRVQELRRCPSWFWGGALHKKLGRLKTFDNHPHFPNQKADSS